jgi:glycosyltransferase involved in cell wall biosynthesis
MPRHILHVVGRLDRGGVETWLLAVLRRTDPTRWTTHFLVHTAKPAAYDAEVQALGGQLHAIRPVGRSPFRYWTALQRLFRTAGPFTVVHSHIHHMSGIVLTAAARARVPVRIAHSHLDTRSLDRAASSGRRLYLRAMQGLLRRSATVGLAASAAAAGALFGEGWRSDPRCRILHYGIDLAPFAVKPEPTTVRAELGLPLDAFVVGHVGRFDTQKNQIALVEALPALLVQEPKARLLFVGADGPGSPADQRARALGVADRVVYAGVRSDVARLMLSAMDVFALPSRYEGLPLVALEAQAAGLPCVLSDGVSEEADAIPALVTRVPLAAGPAPWAGAIARLRAARVPIGTTLPLLDQAGFSVDQSAANLFAVYEQPTT